MAKKQDLESMCEDLKVTIDKTYEDGVTVEEAEKLAARFLSAQMSIATELSACDLDSRMKKNGVKALKAAVYMEEVNRHDKKPSEGFLENTVAMSKLVNDEQGSYDKADARRESLQIYLGIFKDAHIYFRGIAKGRFE